MPSDRCRLDVPLPAPLKAELRASARARHLTMASATRAAIEAFNHATLAAVRGDTPQNDGAGALAGLQRRHSSNDRADPASKTRTHGPG
jgi:hypothetical protein